MPARSFGAERLQTAPVNHIAEPETRCLFRFLLPRSTTIIMLPAFLFYGILFVLLFVFPAALLLVFLLFLDHERQLWRRVAPELEPVALWLGRLPGFLALRSRYPRLTGVILHRFTLRDPFGLAATIAGAVICVGLWFFFGVLHDLSAGDPLAILDLRLHNAVPLFRTGRTTRAMLFITGLGHPITLALLCLAIALMALARDKARLAATFVLAIVGCSLLSVGIKAVVNIPRPPDSIVTASEASFPSGHLMTAAVVYGLLAAMVLGSRSRDWARAVTVSLLMILVGLIGISRLYLGVHWPSDLLGSLAVAMILLAVLFFFQYAKPIAWIDTVHPIFGKNLMHAAGWGVLVLTFIAPFVLYSRTALLPGRPPLSAHVLERRDLNTSFPTNFSPWSQDLTGGRMEPISIVLVGSVEDIVTAFSRAGWTRADPPTPVRLLKEGIAALRNAPDPTGPATPAFFMNQPQSFTFEKPDAGTPTIRRRHHARVWRTEDCLNPSCRPIWVATASFDVGMELSHPLHLPTHRIDPVLDNERAFVATELAGVGVTRNAVLAGVGPQRSKNAAGDPFWTDGSAVVLVMP